MHFNSVGFTRQLLLFQLVTAEVGEVVGTSLGTEVGALVGAALGTSLGALVGSQQLHDIVCSILLECNTGRWLAFFIQIASQRFAWNGQHTAEVGDADGLSVGYPLFQREKAGEGIRGGGHAQPNWNKKWTRNMTPPNV